MVNVCQCVRLSVCLCVCRFVSEKTAILSQDKILTEAPQYRSSYQRWAVHNLITKFIDCYLEIRKNLMTQSSHTIPTLGIENRKKTKKPLFLLFLLFLFVRISLLQQQRSSLSSRSCRFSRRRERESMVGMQARRSKETRQGLESCSNFIFFHKATSSNAFCDLYEFLYFSITP